MTEKDGPFHNSSTSQGSFQSVRRRLFRPDVFVTTIVTSSIQAEPSGSAKNATEELPSSPSPHWSTLWPTSHYSFKYIDQSNRKNHREEGAHNAAHSYDSNIPPRGQKGI